MSRIGIIGSGGKIGYEIVRTLSRYAPEHELKCGYRSNRKEDGNNWVRTDVDDPDDIRNFMEGCDLVINSAGPSEKLSLKVMDAALQSGVSLIDVGHSGCYGEVRSLRDGQQMIYGCGAVPGLIGIIPRRLSEDLDHMFSMNVNISLREDLTFTAARDLVTASELPDGKGAGIRAKTENIPLIGDEVYRYQFTDEESDAVDKLVGVRTSSWYMVRDTDDYEKLFAGTYADKDEMARTLCHLYRISMEGRDDHLKFVIETEGMKDDRPVTMTAYMHGISGSVVSARTASAVAMALLDGCIDETVPVRAALLKDPDIVWEYALKVEAFDVFEIYPNSLDEMTSEESGEI
ncbi:MAG: NAD(P)H-binding protein [Saccharofermentans sp.]|nr:NAD(P)H-binding protein [Saccharofermentans sp.]